MFLEKCKMVIQDDPVLKALSNKYLEGLYLQQDVSALQKQIDQRKYELVFGWQRRRGA